MKILTSILICIVIVCAMVTVHLTKAQIFSQPIMLGSGGIPAKVNSVALSCNPGCSFTVGTSSTLGTLTAVLSKGSFTGSWSLQFAGSDHAGTTCDTHDTYWSITGNTVSVTTLAAGGTYNLCAVATQSSLSNSPFVQAFSVTGGSAGGLGFILGDWGGTFGATPWHTQFSRYPDFSGNFSTLQPDGNSSNPCGAFPGSGNGTYPAFATMEPLGTTGDLDPNAAAAGSYNGDYDTMASQVAACVPGIYFIRVASEWSQPFCASYNPWCGPGGGGTVNWPGGGPCGTPSISSGTFVAMMHNLINRIRANASLTNIPIYFDYPFTTNSGCDESAYYPGNSYVDLVGSDFYYFPVSFPGLTSTQVYNIALGGSNTLPSIQDMEAFAANNSKHIAIVEICDAFSDGGFLTPFYQRAQSKGYVAVDYWDNDGSLPVNTTCILQEVSGRANAFNAVVGGSSYGGSFFTHKPINTSNSFW